jgi:hypothetical protein
MRWDPLRLLREAGWHDAFALVKVDRLLFVFGRRGRAPGHAWMPHWSRPWHGRVAQQQRRSRSVRLSQDRQGDPWRASDHDPILLGFDLAR